MERKIQNDISPELQEFIDNTRPEVLALLESNFIPVWMAEQIVDFRNKLVEFLPHPKTRLLESETNFDSIDKTAGNNDIDGLYLTHTIKHPTEIYDITFSRKDFPTLGISKGFTVKSHKSPENHKLFDNLQDDLWTTLDTNQALPIIITALSQTALKIIRYTGKLGGNRLLNELENMIPEND